MCRLLSVSRTGHLQWRCRPPSTPAQTNARFDAQVAALHAASRSSYGPPRIVRSLRQQGLQVGHKRVRRSLQRQALRPVYKQPYRVKTDSNHRQPVAPNVLERRFDGWQNNRAWFADITYLSTLEGWSYLAVVMALASRRIVGWSMSKRLHAEVLSQALQMAYWRRKPAPGLTMHSDRGSQYASNRLPQSIADFRMSQSMSRKANRWDNAPMESFSKRLKVERVYQLRYETRADARLDIVDWIEGFYNHRRLHSSIGFATPAHIEFSLMAA